MNELTKDDKKIFTVDEIGIGTENIKENRSEKTDERKGKYLSVEDEEQIMQMVNGKRVYYEINEAAAKMAHGMKYYYPYIDGTQTREYKKVIDEAYSIADKIKKNKPEAAESAYRLVNQYSKELAENINRSIEIDCMCPSDMIAGVKNISAKKRQQQNIARNKNMEEYKKIESIKETLKNIASGKESFQNIRSNDAEVSTPKEGEQEKSFQPLKGDEIKQKNEQEIDRIIDGMTPEEKEDHVQAVEFAIDYGQQEYISEEDMKLYEQIIDERKENRNKSRGKNQVLEFDGKDNKRILSESEIATMDAPTHIDVFHDKLQEMYDLGEISYEEFEKRRTILYINNQIGIYGLERHKELFTNLPMEQQIEVSQQVQKGLQTLVNIDELNNGKISYDTIKAIATQGYIYQDGKVEKASHVETENKFFKKIENSEKMKLQLVFYGKPNEKIRDVLKENHFYWSAKDKAWQRLLTGNARYAFDTVLNELEKLDKQGEFKVDNIEVEEGHKKVSSNNSYKKYHGKEFEQRGDNHDLENQLLSAQNNKIKKLLQTDTEPRLESEQNTLQQERLGMVEDVDLEIEIQA